MRTSRNAKCLLATTVVFVAAVPGTAHAAIEDFETPAHDANTEVAQQFRASNGIYFTANGPAGIYLPRIATDASKSPMRSIDITTAPNEFPRPALEGRFDTEVTNLTVPVRNLFTGAAASLRLDAYGAVSGSKSSGFVTVNSGAWVNLTVPPADAGNGYTRFQVVSPVGTNDGMEIRVDDIDFTVDPAAAPNFSLLTEDIGGVALAGQTKEYTIAVQRVNGFTGSVTLSGSATTSGESVSFTPNPVTGDTSTARMTLPSSTPNGTATLTVTGTGAPGTRTLEIPFTVEQPFTVESDANFVETNRCSTAEFPLEIIRNRFFSDPIELSVAHQSSEGVIPPDLAVTVTPESLTTPDTTVNNVTVRVTRGDTEDSPAPVPLRLTARSGSVTRTLDFEVRRIPPRLTLVNATTLFTPQALFAGSGLTVRGNGLCEGAQIRFGNEQAQAPATFSAAPTADNPTQVQLTSSTPRLATSGPISVVNPSGAVASAAGLFPDVTVNGYRNRFGFNFENEDGSWDDVNEDGVTNEADEPRPVGAGSLRDWQELVGPHRTNYDACELGALFPGCWEVITPVPTIQHLIMQTIFGEASLYDRGGTCVGLAVASRRIAARQASVVDRPSGGELAPVWSLQRTGRETILGRRDIPFSERRHFSPIKYGAIQHAAQLTAEYIELWAGRRFTNAVTGPNAMRSAIEGHLRAGRYPLININWDGGGHAVNVYDIEDRPGGGYFMRVYDNNWEFRTSENADGVQHQFRDQDRSRIEVTPGGAWTAHGIRFVTERDDEGRAIADAPRTGPTGNLSWIAVENELPRFPSSLASLDGLRVLATPGAGDTLRPAARIAQDGDSGLLELGYLDGEGSMVAADSSKAHSIPVSPGNGSGEIGIFGEGSTARVDATGGGAGASAAGGNRVLLPKGEAEGIGYRAGSASTRVGLTLIAGRAGRMVRIAGARGGTTRVRFVGKNDRIEIVHNGRPGRIRLELASFPDRRRASQFSTTLRLGRKGTVRLAPRWKRLGRRMVARVGGRRVVLRNSARPPVRVSDVRMKASRRGSQARASVRARLRGRLGRLRALVVHVQVTKGRRVVGRATQQLGAGRRAIRRLARGTRLNVPLSRNGRRGKLTARAIVTASAGSPVPIGSSGAVRAPVR